MEKKVQSRLLLATMLLCCLVPTPRVMAGERKSADGVSAQDLKTRNLTVDQRIYQKDWNSVPFSPKYFTYTDKQMKEKWAYLMRGLRGPYPSTELLAYTIKHYPEAYKGVPKDLLSNPAELHKQVMECWRLFFAGRFQESWRKGQTLGAVGMMPGAFSELLYGMYLADRHSVKDMMLQDIVNLANRYNDVIERMSKSDRKDIREAAAFSILGKAYAMGRIAEEAPIPVIVARGYFHKITKAANRVLDLVPDHPLGHAFLAGLDAGIMRKVGKFTGRLTYGARTTTVQNSFDLALDKVPDVAILQYEYANALIYMNRKRELNLAMRHLEKATRIRPAFAMEALDSMYAYKRLQEIRMYALNYRSFREFEKDRFNFMRVTDRNITSVLTPPLTMDMLKHPDKYKLSTSR